MLRHVVLFRWNEATTAEDIDRIQAGLDTLPGLIPEIRAYTHGRDLRLGEGTWDYAVVADFDDAAAWSVYDAHPKHEEVPRGPIRAHIGERAVARFEV